MQDSADGQGPHRFPPGFLRKISTVTLAAVVASVSMTYLFSYLGDGDADHVGPGLYVAALVPLIIAPIATFKLLILLSQLQSLNDKLKIASRLDPLTGALNRREFFAAAENQLQLAARHGFPLSLLMIDFDHFKEVNDAFGHKVGDEVLTKGCAQIQPLLRDTDLFARYGGEEFVLLLPYSANAGEVAERIRLTLEGFQVNTAKGTVAVTISIGFGSWQGPGESLSELIERVDLALYQAKAHGRNRVEAAGHTLAIRN